jgi:predicted small secreted protein
MKQTSGEHHAEYGLNVFGDCADSWNSWIYGHFRYLGSDCANPVRGLFGSLYRRSDGPRAAREISSGLRKWNEIRRCTLDGIVKCNKGETSMPTNIKTLMLSSLIVLSLGLSACETVEGAGRDIEDAGESVQRSAN